MQSHDYLMENPEESRRLVMKTGSDALEQQARWAGLEAGMRVADIGCGPGKTTYFLNQLVQPGGSALGIDFSQERIAFAQQQYGGGTVSFARRDLLKPIQDLGEFDFAWVRFFLEYHRSDCFELVQNVATLLKPGGILCMIDLDHNSLSHYGHPARMERTMAAITKNMEEKENFDPYMGRKLYSFLYDLGFADINVKVEAHHQIFGELNEVDEFNWTKKLEVVARHYDFEEYAGGYEEFREEFRNFFASPRRFTYTPIISCRGCKPVSA